MKHLLVTVPVTFLGAAMVACGTRPTEIADVSVVTTMPKEVGPGGYEKTFGADGMATGVFFKATLSDCGAEIETTGRAWAEQHGLTASSATPQSGVRLLQFTADRLPDGMFVIRYTMTPDLASVHVTHQATGAGKSRPTAEFADLGFAALIENLLNAAKCDAKGQALARPAGRPRNST
jgi:hypothetical protein